MSAILKQSLLFNTIEHNKHRAFNRQDGTGYQAKIMVQILKSSGLDFGIQEFKTIDALRSFTAENYMQHKRLFDIAMNNELSQLKAIVYILNLEIAEEMRTHLVDAAQYNVIDHVYSHIKLPKSAHKNLKACSYISISKDFYKEIKRIVLLEDDKEIEIDISKHQLKKSKE